MTIEIFREPGKTLYGYVIEFNEKRYIFSGYGCLGIAVMAVINRLYELLKRGDFKNE